MEKKFSSNLKQLSGRRRKKILKNTFRIAVTWTELKRLEKETLRPRVQRRILVHELGNVMMTGQGAPGVVDSGGGDAEDASVGSVRGSAGFLLSSLGTHADTHSWRESGKNKEPRQ